MYGAAMMYLRTCYDNGRGRILVHEYIMSEACLFTTRLVDLAGVPLSAPLPPANLPGTGMGTTIRDTYNASKTKSHMYILLGL
jgi:hypothetical protein